MSVSGQITNEFRIEDGMVMEYYGTGGLVDIPFGVQDIFFQVSAFLRSESENRKNFKVFKDIWAWSYLYRT